MNEDIQDILSKAMHMAFQMGQVYWQQADSEYYSQNKKADATQQKFYVLIDEIRAEIASTPNV